MWREVLLQLEREKKIKFKLICKQSFKLDYSALQGDCCIPPKILELNQYRQCCQHQFITRELFYLICMERFILQWAM